MSNGVLAQEPSLSILDASKPHSFIVPKKEINEGHDVSTFLTSKAYSEIMTFLLQLNRAMFPSFVQISGSDKASVQSWELGSRDTVFSDTVQSLARLLQDLNRIVEEAPPDPGPRRFGNVSFRKWCEKVKEQSSKLLEQYLPVTVLSFPHSSAVTAKEELSAYLLGSFGSSQRLDYGSGHELSFLAFLGGVWKLGGFDASSSAQGEQERGIVLGIIDPYLQLVRRLIKMYNLEPAGSHGVWGLDDHSFIPYIFGSAQYGPAISSYDLIPTEGSRANAPDPADVARTDAVQRERSKNMYFSAIGFIHDVKKGPFWEHSPMLYDISGVSAGWGKINKGMIKMYNAEVLSKFPVVQHFRFGSLFSWEPDSTAPSPPSSIHTSSQPVKETTSTGKISDRSSLHRGDAQQSLLPQPTARRNGAAPATAAPWASSRPTPTSDTGFGLPLSRFPQAQSRARVFPDNAENVAADARSMPPPTRASWAKPP